MKQTLIIVDGLNLSHTRSSLNIKSYNFSGLYELLTSLSDYPIWDKPLYSINEKAFAIKKPLAQAGFEAIETERSMDDSVIINIINSANTDEIGAIVIVSGDRDFFPAILEKEKLGVKIFWVSTDHKDRNGRSMIGNHLLDTIKNSGITFVDLYDYREKIGFGEWTVVAKKDDEQARNGLEAQTPVTMDIGLHFTGPMCDANEFLKKIIGMATANPSIKWKYTIEGGEQ